MMITIIKSFEILKFVIILNRLKLIQYNQVQNKMGASGPEYCKPKKHNLGLLYTREPRRLLAFTIKNYDRKGRIGDHPEVQSLIESRFGYFILRLSYTTQGMVVERLSLQRVDFEDKTINHEKSYVIDEDSTEYAWIELAEVAITFDKKEYSIISNNCQDFVKKIKSSLSFISSETYSNVWEIYYTL